MGLGSTLIFLVIGTLLTVVIQSSSATMALTLVMCNNGWISFESAAAMVLGENIGTTITANIAAMVANASAKRAARLHFLFNVVGVIWVISILPFFLKGVDSLTISVSGKSAFTNAGSIPIALSFFHTFFNISNVLLQIWFVKYLVILVQKMVPDREEDQEFKLKYIKFGMLSTSELSILQAKKEIIVYAQQTKKLFGRLKNMLVETNERKFQKQFDKMDSGEDKSDEMEVSIARYLTKVAEGELSKESSRGISAMLRIIDEIESIGDSSLNISRAMLRSRDKNKNLTPDMQKNILEMFSLVEKALDVMIENLSKSYRDVDKRSTETLEKKINEFRNKLRSQHVHDIESEVYPYQVGTLYKDIFSESEKIGDYIYEVTMSIADSVNSQF
jgi:phosphate:Na+ symporter